MVCLIYIKDLFSGTLHSRFVQSYLIMFAAWLSKCVVVASTVICRYARVWKTMHIFKMVIMLRKIYNEWKRPNDLSRAFERRCVCDWDRYLSILFCDLFSAFQRSLKNLGDGSVKKIIQFHKQVWMFSGFSFKIIKCNWGYFSKPQNAKLYVLTMKIWWLELYEILSFSSIKFGLRNTHNDWLIPVFLNYCFNSKIYQVEHLLKIRLIRFAVCPAWSPSVLMGRRMQF